MVAKDQSLALLQAVSLNQESTHVTLISRRSLFFSLLDHAPSMYGECTKRNSQLVYGSWKQHSSTALTCINKQKLSDYKMDSRKEKCHVITSFFQ